MSEKFNIKFEGDKSLWVIAGILAIASIMPVYSASSNLTFSHGGSSPMGYLIKHIITLGSGFLIMYFLHKVNYRYFAPFAVMAMPFVLILLIYTLAQGTTMGNANASRWITLPVVGFTFQSSALASLVLMIFLARHLAKQQTPITSLKQMWLPLLLPIGAVCALILPANFSTTAIVFAMSMAIMFIGGVHWKPLLQIIGLGIAGLALFIVIVMAFPNISNRVSTWQARIENFASGSVEENYQVDKAKMAIAQGQVIGLGPGKSVQKSFLPQSNSDFIYAIIVEEFGLVGGTAVIFLYAMLFVRIIRIAIKSPNTYGTLITIAAGMGIIIQALINMGVAVNIFPVTGQTLPLVSSGGTSIWMTCTALGIILSASQATQTKEADTTSKTQESKIEDAATA